MLVFQKEMFGEKCPHEEGQNVLENSKGGGFFPKLMGEYVVLNLNVYDNVYLSTIMLARHFCHFIITLRVRS